ncbi:hydrolase tropI [Colletotrichum spaethianum]|uniref:Hydrolase tropI n=1 Tax=Colletotrichum spaethianum TaxID=700344 RepID=A0AA37PCS3_9PEZI|nr:hydrolase tropI [Colletotrichum spaethianum]GKT49812.1 hydrolase tropI [Colletotrichum spaethianum]
MPAKGSLCIVIGLMSFIGITRGFVADLSILAFAGTPTGKVVPFNGHLFDGKPKPQDPKASFNVTEFFGAHGPEVTDQKVEKAISYLREKMGIQKIASTGYCFGGRYAFRALGIPQNKGVLVGFAAHPSLLGDEEIKAIKGPASLAVAEGDASMMANRRTDIEAAMGTTGQPFTMTLYGGTPHGFATHPDLNNPVQKAAKEDAFLQAVRFFETWL